MDDLIAAAGRTPPQIAALFDVTPRTVRRWRSGATPAPLAAVMQMGLLADPGPRLKSHHDCAQTRLAARAWVMRHDGLSAIHRRLGIGYGDAARMLSDGAPQCTAAATRPPLRPPPHKATLPAIRPRK